jgi:beta-N-acetylglucosaminidase
VKLTGKSKETETAVLTDTSDDISSDDMTDAEFEQYLKSEGFPESYRKKLIDLHREHPDWGFTAYKTGISWKEALTRQTKGGTSLVSGSCPKAYRSGSKQYEKGWYKANSKVVAHYMDPRNFLNENCIYMFEDLSYKPKYQTAEVVSAILSPTKLPDYGFTAAKFVKAGKNSGVSPVFLASRARQETGNGGDAVNGTKILGKKVYNPFNIGAFGGTNPLYNGLIYAYGKGWTTPAKAINGGASELAENYISQGQYTLYYQRFNVRNGEKKVGTHQYMTNIMAPYSEAVTTKRSYAKYGITDKALTFEIPVYEGMPSSTKLP